MNDSVDVVDVNDRIGKILSLLGNVLLIPCRYKSKAPRGKWGSITLASMSDEKYLAKLAKGNIGVVLGEKSGNLCAVDLDRDDLRESFLAANPWARNTTEVRGSRGSKFFVRVLGQYPPTSHLFRGKEDVAQWLAGGAQAIVSGRHPEGMDYHFLNPVPVVEIAYASITWPVGLTIPSHEESDFTEQQSIGASESKSIGVAEPPDVVLMFDLWIAARKAVPEKVHQNNAMLFRLARAMKDIQKRYNRQLSFDELKVAFGHWAKKAKPYWREGQSFDEYWFEFLDACANARLGLEESILALAWQAVVNSPIPPEALDAYQDPRLRRVMSLCHKMQTLSEERPFFIPTRWLAEQFNVTPPTAASWLRGLFRHRFLILAKVGTTTRCPRYFYAPLHLDGDHPDYPQTGTLLQPQASPAQ